jgi:hypothetical protein
MEMSETSGALMRTLSFALIVSVFGTVTAISQEPSAAKPYESPDAYKIYSLLLPHEESYGFANGGLIIQQETQSEDAPFEGACLSSDVAKRFKDAISDYRRVGKTIWLLQRQFKIEKPYELVTSDRIALVLKSERDPNIERYPTSGGYIFMSAVGFNKNKTLAIVYTGSMCGGLCGSSRFHFLQKVGAKWKEVPVGTCVISS